MLPQRGALTRIAARQQQGARGVLAEPGREQRRTAHFLGHRALEFVRVEEEQLGPGRFLVRGGHPQDDAVVTGLGRGVETPAFLQASAHGQRPGGVHRFTERAVQHHAPVAQLVAEPLDHQGAVIGNVLGGLALLVQIREQVVLRPLVEPGSGQALAGTHLRGPADLTRETADGAPQFHGPAQSVAVPERELSGDPRGRGDHHAVVGDVLHPPAGGTQGNDVPDAGFVDHFLVEFAHALGVLAVLIAHQEHGEQAAVGNGAAGGHGQP